MSKKIEDYLHLYIGCQCQHCGEVDEVKKLTGISFDDTQKVLWAYFENEENCYAPASEVKPILRRLSDKNMSTDDLRDWNMRRQRKGWMPGVHADNTAWLLSKGFDLFGLIDEGLAIDAVTIKTND